MAGEEVCVWVYEETLKVEYQAIPLSQYAITLAPDHRQISEVTASRRIETHFRSPQLDLWQTGDTEWLLAVRRPAPGVRKKRSQLVALARQQPLPFPEFGAIG